MTHVTCMASRLGFLPSTNTIQRHRNTMWTTNTLKKSFPPVSLLSTYHLNGPLSPLTSTVQHYHYSNSSWLTSSSVSIRRPRAHQKDNVSDFVTSIGILPLEYAAHHLEIIMRLLIWPLYPWNAYVVRRATYIYILVSLLRLSLATLMASI